MKFSTLAAVIAGVYASVATAGMVTIPTFSDQAVEKLPGDCPYGIVTPMGCAPARD